MGNARFPPDRVDRKSDPVQDASALNYGLASLAVERKRHREDGLKCVPLRAACRRDIGLAGRHARGIVEDIGDRLSLCFYLCLLIAAGPADMAVDRNIIRRVGEDQSDLLTAEKSFIGICVPVHPRK
jgi:hypothetical protein